MSNQEIPPHVKPLQSHEVDRIPLAGGAQAVIRNSEYETYIFKSGCRHGASSDEMDVVVRLPIIDGHDEARTAAIHALDKELGYPSNRQDHSIRYRTVTETAMLQYWTQPNVNKYIDDKLVKIILAMAAEEIISNQIGVARRYVMLAAELRIAVDKFGGDLLQLRRHLQQSPETIQQLRTVDYKGRTDRGLKIVLDELLPCSCMSGAKQTQKTSRCGYCRKDDVKQKLLRCSGCKGMDYCSKECQKKDWKNHKLLCRATSAKPK